MSSILTDLNKIFNLYGSGTPTQIASHNSSRGENDFRMVYIVEFQNNDKIAVKVTKNTFTTSQRVKGWAELIEHYNKLGIYCPKIICNKQGEHCATVDGYLVFAEDYSKYKTVTERDEFVTVEQKYKRKLYESIGAVAANSAPLVPWHTAYCIYDKFDIMDKFDENYECALAFRDYYNDNITEYAIRAEKIFKEYCHRREKFEPTYRLLPKAVFQGDINDSNILITPTDEFKGMIDFNLSGTETILNYTFCESFCNLADDSEIDILLDTEALRKRDAWTAQRMAWIGKYYKFTDEEKEAFNEYYNIVAPFRWPYHCFFLSLLSKREKYPDGRKYARHILDWTEYQMTRNDVSSLLP